MIARQMAHSKWQALIAVCCILTGLSGCPSTGQSQSKNKRQSQ